MPIYIFTIVSRFILICGIGIPWQQPFMAIRWKVWRALQSADAPYHKRRRSLGPLGVDWLVRTGRMKALRSLLYANIWFEAIHRQCDNKKHFLHRTVSVRRCTLLKPDDYGDRQSCMVSLISMTWYSITNNSSWLCQELITISMVVDLHHDTPFLPELVFPSSNNNN